MLYFHVSHVERLKLSLTFCHLLSIRLWQKASLTISHCHFLGFGRGIPSGIPLPFPNTYLYSTYTIRNWQRHISRCNLQGPFPWSSVFVIWTAYLFQFQFVVHTLCFSFSCFFNWIKSWCYTWSTDNTSNIQSTFINSGIIMSSKGKSIIVFNLSICWYVIYCL